MSEHTPEPLHAECGFVLTADGRQVADVNNSEVSEHERVANAALFAQAPTLLRENKELREQVARLREACKDALVYVLCSGRGFIPESRARLREQIETALRPAAPARTEKPE